MGYTCLYTETFEGINKFFGTVIKFIGYTIIIFFGLRVKKCKRRKKIIIFNKPHLFSAEFGRLRWMLASRDVDGMKEMMRKSTARRIALDQGK